MDKLLFMQTKIAIALFGVSQGFLVSLVIPEYAFSQITPDSTLPTASSVNQVLNTINITGGTTANTNLFHSFNEFNIPANTTAHFRNSALINNIFARVTGSGISNIDGILKADFSANVFLINPNGIIFGQAASLEIGGSFLATTANIVKFSDGSEFHARASSQTTSPLLMMTAPVGLQFIANSGANGEITARGVGNGLDYAPPIFAEIVRSTNPSLNVQTGQTLALIGGDVTLEGANLTADSGRIELGSVAGNGFVAIAQTNTTSGTKTITDWRLNYDQVPILGNIRLQQAAMADTSGKNGGGSIQVQGNQVTLNDGSVLLSSSVGSGNGSEISVRATDLLSLRGESSTPFPSSILTDTGKSSTGKGSNIAIAAKRLELTGGGQISAGTFGSGSAGNIEINASDILLEGRSDSDIYASGVFSQVLDEDVTGKSGNIVVNTDNLQISLGGQITTGTFGIGNAGNIDVTAKNITLIGKFLNPTSIFTGAVRFSSGNGGILTIKSETLSFDSGAQVAVGTAGSGNAGNLLVNVKFIDIAGRNPDGRSGFFANAVVDKGDGGNITIESDRLIVRNEGIISASNFRSNGTSPGSGSVGNIKITSPSILLDGGIINIDSVGGTRGNIDIISNLMVLRNGSTISTNAFGSATGGVIEINADFLVAVPTENSDITANAVNNFGGRNIVTAKGVVGFQTGKSLTDLSDITATSALGTQFNGLVEIRTPDADLSRGLVKLPDNLTDANKQIVAACDRFRGNELISTGRGGVPTDATQTISSQAIWRDLRLSEIPSTQPSPTAQTTSNQVATQPFPKIEAQGWEKLANGNLKLLAYADSPPVWRSPVICPVNPIK